MIWGACIWRGLFSEFCTVACRDKTLPRIQNMPQITKRFPEIQKSAADTKHVPEFKSIPQNLKILPRNQILGHGLDSGVRFVLTRHHTFGLWHKITNCKSKPYVAGAPKVTLASLFSSTWPVRLSLKWQGKISEFTWKSRGYGVLAFPPSLLFFNPHPLFCSTHH